jgi:hypothetical protein
MNNKLNHFIEILKLLNTIESIMKEIKNDNRCRKLKNIKNQLLEELKNIDIRVLHNIN